MENSTVGAMQKEFDRFVAENRELRDSAKKSALGYAVSMRQPGDGADAVLSSARALYLFLRNPVPVKADLALGDDDGLLSIDMMDEDAV